MAGPMHVRGLRPLGGITSRRHLVSAIDLPLHSMSCMTTSELGHGKTERGTLRFQFKMLKANGKKVKAA